MTRTEAIVQSATAEINRAYRAGEISNEERHARIRALLNRLT